MNPERDFVWQNMSAIYDGNMSVSENSISESKFRVTPAVPSMLEIKSHFMLSNYVFIHVSRDILTMTLWTCGRRFVFLAPGILEPHFCKGPANDAYVAVLVDFLSSGST